jgi:hypothetical protein
MKQLNAAQVLQQIAQIQHMEPGKLCIIGQGPNGPYYNLQCREQGKTLTRYVPGDQVEQVAQHTANYQKFESLVSQYAQLIIEQTRAERSAGLKKKTSRPRSSWPKTRKSSS